MLKSTSKVEKLDVEFGCNGIYFISRTIRDRTNVSRYSLLRIIMTEGMLTMNTPVVFLSV